MSLHSLHNLLNKRHLFCRVSALNTSGQFETISWSQRATVVLLLVLGTIRGGKGWGRLRDLGLSQGRAQGQCVWRVKGIRVVKNSSSENLNFVFYKSASGALEEQTNVYCNFAKLHEQYYAIWEIKKTHKTASVPAATGHPDQRHWFKKQRGKWEKLYTFWFENSPDGKDFSSRSHVPFMFPKTWKGAFIVIGIDKRDLFKLKSPEPQPDALLSDGPMRWGGGVGAVEQLSVGCSPLSARGWHWGGSSPGHIPFEVRSAYSAERGRGWR